MQPDDNLILAGPVPTQEALLPVIQWLVVGSNARSSVSCVPSVPRFCLPRINEWCEETAHCCLLNGSPAAVGTFSPDAMPPSDSALTTVTMAVVELMWAMQNGCIHNSNN